MKIPFANRPPARRRVQGFTLTETVISIGIVATALLPLVALLGTSTRSQVTATDRLSATLIAEAVFEELAATTPRPYLLVDPAGTASSRVEISADGSGGSDTVIYLSGDIHGRLIGEIDAGSYQSGAQRGMDDGKGGGDEAFVGAGAGVVPGTLLRLEVSAGRRGEAGVAGRVKGDGSSAGGELVRVQLSVEHPADAPQEVRRKQVFETFLHLSGG